MKKCKQLATHNVLSPYRHLVGGIEYLCTEHSAELEKVYGEDSVKRMEFVVGDGEVSLKPTGEGGEDIGSD